MRAVRRAAALVLAAVLVLGGLGTGGAPGAGAADEPPTLAVVELTVSVTSDWARVSLLPGRLAGTRVMSNPGNLRITMATAGATLVRSSSTTGSATAVLRAVYEERRGTDLRLVTDKGYNGAVRVVVRNLAPEPFTVAETVNRLHQSSNVQRTPITRSAMFRGRDADLPKADPRRLVLAFYFPWFYNDDYDDPTLADRPSAPSASTYRAADVLAMTRQAKANGIDGFVVSWQGARRNGVGLDRVLYGAGQTGSLVSVYLETANANTTGVYGDDADRDIVKQWLSEALVRAGNRTFLRSGGVPVVFVYRMWLLPPAEWRAITAELEAAGTPVRLVGSDPDPALGTALWGSHRFSIRGMSEWGLRTWNQTHAVDVRAPAAVDPSVSPQLFAATVSPGYDDSNLRGDTYPVEPRGENGERYDAAWRAALASDPDWVLVTTWNEWFEGTAVQPGRKNGDLALRQTADWSARFKSRSRV